MHLHGWKPEVTSGNIPGQEFSEFIANPKTHLFVPRSSDIIDWRGNCSPIEDQRDIGSCFHGDTLVRLLNGTKRSIQELYEARGSFWIYSCSLEGRMIPGRAEAKLTGEQQKVIKVILDNDKEIICTPEHQFMLRDGMYCEAQDLTTEQSLMPFESIQELESLIRVYDHKIKSIEFLSELVNVYCLTVDNEYHNFALDAGVFVHNCVSNAVVADLEFLENVQGLPHVDLSRMFVYYNARLEIGNELRDDGSHISLAFGTLNRHGVCSESTWAYDPSKVFTRPSWMSYREAYAHTLSRAFRITSSGQSLHDDIITALRSQHCVVFGMEVWDGLMKCTGLLEVPDTSKPSLGRHAMLLVGYLKKENLYIVRNSWGEYWGDKGYCYITPKIFELGAAQDFWVGTFYQ